MKPEEFEELERIIHDLALRAPSGRSPKSIAAELGKPYTSFMGEIAWPKGKVAGRSKAKLGIKDFIRFLHLSGSARPLRWIADRLGYLLIRKPRPGESTEDCIREFLAASDRFGKLATTLRDATMDGQINGEEPRRIREAGLALVGSVMALIVAAYTARIREPKLSQLPRKYPAESSGAIGLAD